MSKSLGRGLSSLIPPQSNGAGSASASINVPSAISSILSETSQLRVIEVSVASIVSNPYQPRKTFSDPSMEELKASVQAHGILQPLLVTREGEKFQLIAGERRLRAAKALHLKTVPVIIRKTSDLEKLELAIVENVQREDLNPIEEAESYLRLIEEFDLTQDEAAKKCGKSRSQISNALRLLKLPGEIQHSLASGKLSVGHAKILLSIEDPEQQRKMWKQILEQGMSVAETTHRTQQTGSGAKKKSRHPFLETQEEDLRRILGTKVRIQPSGKGGRILIEYYSAEELLSLIQKMIQRKA